MATASKIGRSLVAPGQLASILNWKRSCSVMALNITEDMVGVAIAAHPYDNSVVLPFDPIALAEKKHSNNIDGSFAASRLEDLAQRYNVGAIVVGWPLQPEGRPGKPCGKVIHTLEQWVDQKAGSVLSEKRPFTLWDNREKYEVDEKEQHMDEWGRCIAFSRTPSQGDKIFSSKDTYQQGEPNSSEKASGILKAFLCAFWKENRAFQTQKFQNTKTMLVDEGSFEESSALL